LADLGIFARAEQQKAAKQQACRLSELWGMMRPPVLLALAMVFAAQAHASDPAVIEKAVKTCVDFVHTLPQSNKEWPSAWFDSFDAYYNPATGRVVTIESYDIAKFQFDKCMAGQGVPLHE
jgi:hypothetical protein